jgi:hypothetical protein
VKIPPGEPTRSGLAAFPIFGNARMMVKPQGIYVQRPESEHRRTVADAKVDHLLG